MSLSGNIGAVVSRKRLAILAGVILLYCFWIYGLSTNPPGFYSDESCIAYNGYLIATTAAEEDGKMFPLYIHCYTEGWSQYMSAGQPYALALLYLFISPSPLSARVFAATLVFLAILILGLLASKISGRTSVGIIVALSGMATPWLFEYSRLVMETFFLILCISSFLFFLYGAQKRERWKFTDVLAIAILLTLITYSYATGRVIGPLFCFGLLIFAGNSRALFDVFKVWIIYALTMIPIIVLYVTNPGIIAGRFLRATNLSIEKSLLENIGAVLSALNEDISLKFFVTNGDELLRHHIPKSGMGEFLVATFALGLLGIVIVLIRHRSSRWWCFILFGAFVSLLPGAITFERYHSMRGLAFPIFFLILTIPAISWLLGLYGPEADSSSDIKGGSGYFISSTERYLRLGLLSLLLLLTAVQAVQFQRLFWKNGTDAGRKAVFHESYPRALERALAEPDRPIYLHDFGEPTYIHAFWYGVSMGLDPSTFVHLLDREEPPEGALVLSSKVTCDGCQVVYLDGGYLLYRNQRLDSSEFSVPVPADPAIAPSVFSSGPGSEQGQFSHPRGLATDAIGNLYVADGGNGRIQKFDPNGKFLIEFGKNGTPETNLKDPNGVAVDIDGNIYVVDVGTHRLTKFNPEGVFENVYDGAGTGFYGPRDLTVVSNKQLYIIDQGRQRIAAFDLVNKKYTHVWGTGGPGEGQFNGMTGIAAGDDLIFVADQGNGRIQVFGPEGNFVSQWEIPSWTRSVLDTPDVAFDENTKVVYVTVGKTNEVLAFDVNGTPMPDFELHDTEKLKDPGAMAISEAAKKRWLYVLNRGNSTVVRFELQGPKKKK